MTDFRTPLARARGLGSAKDGLHHWWMQRVTAIALIPLVVWFAISLIMLTGADFAVVRAWIGSPLVMILLTLTIAVGLYHGQLGLQVVWEDYTDGATRIVLILLTKFIAVLFGLGAILAIMRIGFGG
jgi:succinate dehydrogenase / fumarate reductase, membrane anchor subunit